MKRDKFAISVILPTLNEKGNIVKVIESIKFSLINYNHEIIIVDDGSIDGTAQAVESAAKLHQNISLLVHTPPKNLGDSILLGIKYARNDIIVGMDADGNHDPSVIPSMIYELQFSQLVVGSRFLPTGGMSNKLRYIYSKYFNIFLRSVYGFPLTDNTSGFYAIRRAHLISLNPDTIYYGYGEYHLRLVHASLMHNFQLKEIPIRYGDREYGQSKSKLFTMGLTYLRVARELYRSSS